MKRLRPVVHVLLGLVLMVQGIAVAAAERGVQEPEAVAAAASTDTVVPCHEGAPVTAASCCDEACPDMTTCALSHLATAPAAAPVIGHATSSVPSASTREPDTAPRPSFLRPPIAPHG